MNKKVIILNFHQIVKSHSSGIDLFAITEDDFRKQVDFISKQNITVCSLSDIIDNNLKDKINVAFTFDDGNDSDIGIAIPILNKYGFTATFFINTEVENTNWVGYKNSLQLGFDVESHGTNHKEFKKLSIEQKIQSLNVSKSTIEFQLNNDVQYFAFPYGSYTSKDVDLALKNGYKAVFSTTIDRNSTSESKIYHRWSIKNTVTMKQFSKALTDDKFFSMMEKKSRIKNRIKSIVGHKVAYKLSKISKL